MPLQILIPVFAALAGAGLAAFAGEVRNYVELRRERRKAVNRVLWCQLDLWFSLKRFDVEGALGLIMPNFVQGLGLSQDSALSHDQISIAGDALAETFLDTRDPTMDQKYAASVEELANFEPVLAHSLSGRTTFQRYRDQTAKYLDMVKSQLHPDAPPDPTFVEHFREFMQREMLATLLDVLRGDIDAVGQMVDRRTRRQLRSVMTDWKARVEDDRERIAAVSQRMKLWFETEVLLADDPSQSR